MIVVVCPGFHGIYIVCHDFFVVFKVEMLYTMVIDSANE